MEQAITPELDTSCIGYIKQRAATGDLEPDFLRPLTHDYWIDPSSNHWTGLRPFGPADPLPAATITMPVEIVREQRGTIFHAVRQIARASDRLAAPLEVFMWANTALTSTSVIPLEEDRQHMLLAMNRLERLKDGLSALSLPPQIRLRLAHRFQMPGENFNQIRSRYMQHIVLEATGRKLPGHHPVIWLDADTPFIIPHAIPLLIDAVLSRRAHFVHANTVYSGSRRNAPPLAQRPEAEKVAALYALTRRMIERNLEPTDPRGYVEESGLAFSIETWRRTGGNALADPTKGESRTLLERGRAALDPAIPLLSYIERARIGNSYRRFERLAETHYPCELPGMEDGPEYVDFQNMTGSQPMQCRDRPVTNQDAWEMVGRMTARQEARTNTSLTPAQVVRLERIIGRCAFAP
jgi:hypothetical protein